MSAPVERKVSAAALSAAISGVVVWVLSAYAFHGAVPEGLQSLLDVAIPAVSALTAGWLTRHSPRVVEDNTPMDAGNDG